MSHTYIDDGEDDGCHCYCDECKLRRSSPTVLGPYKPPTYREHKCEDHKQSYSAGSFEFKFRCYVCGKEM